MNIFIIIAIGLLGGLSSGLFGIGGGTVFVPMLVLLAGLNPHIAIGTSLAVVVPTAIIGAVTHGKAEMVDWKLAMIIAVSAMIGAWLGSLVSIKIDEVLLRRLFALLLVVVAFKMFFTK